MTILFLTASWMTRSYWIFSFFNFYRSILINMLSASDFFGLRGGFLTLRVEPASGVNLYSRTFVYCFSDSVKLSFFRNSICLGCGKTWWDWVHVILGLNLLRFFFMGDSCSLSSLKLCIVRLQSFASHEENPYIVYLCPNAGNVVFIFLSDKFEKSVVLRSIGVISVVVALDEASGICVVDLPSISSGVVLCYLIVWYD